MCAVVMANHCNGRHLPGVSIHNKTYCKNYITYKNLSSSLNYNFSNYFYLATEQNKTKTLLGCSSCSINISYHFHSSSLLPQFKKSSYLSCKNSSL